MCATLNLQKMINIRFYMRSEIVFDDLPMCGQDEHLEIYDMAVAVWRWEDSSPYQIYAPDCATASPVGQPLRDVRFEYKSSWTT